MNISRRKFLVLGCCALGATALAEPHLLERTEKQIPMRRPLSRPIRVLHLADFHWSSAVSLRFIEHAIDLGIELRPDLICLTGDYVTDKSMDLARYVPVLKKLSAVCPTVACLGNHDGGAWAAKTDGYKTIEPVMRTLNAAAIDVLFNRCVDVTVGGSNLVLVGLGDLWANDARPELAFSALRLDDSRPRIVLSHNPDSKELLSDYPWDLMLSGHTHGGQLIVPFLGLTPFAPVRDKRYVHGLRTWNSRHIHITRGVGNLHGLRFNCRPEVSMLVLTC